MLVLSIILYGCGFRLAGTGEFSTSLDNTAVQGVNTSKELQRIVENNLRVNSINIVEADEADAILTIHSEETEKIVLTLDNDGKAREFELILNIVFDVKSSDDSYLLAQQNISLNRDFVFDKSNLLGSNEEEVRLLSEMRVDAARLITRRLQSIPN